MNKALKIVYILSTIGVVLIVIMALAIALDKINEERCYKLPLNDFHKDKNCWKYTQTWDELLGE